MNNELMDKAEVSLLLIEFIDKRLELGSKSQGHYTFAILNVLIEKIFNATDRVEIIHGLGRIRIKDPTSADYFTVTTIGDKVKFSTLFV